jgi:Family of unknown function (DUF5681)
MTENYDVGYGKPPQHTRFRKGHSGNPRGRPKGSLDVKTELGRLLAIKTKIKINGAVQTVSTAKALCLALIQKAMGGGVRAFSKIVEIVGPEMADELKATASVSSADIEILRHDLARKDRSVCSAASSLNLGQPEETE